ncbi:MAG: porin [Bacteroidetes bacterium]|nr:porin [Bacteroidota bacterium]
MIKKHTTLITLLLLSFLTQAQIQPASEKKTLWYESFSIRGYVQARYNRLLETNAQLKCEQCDRSWGEGGGFFLRRIRVILFGQISKNVYFYLQPDFASSASTTGLHFAQIRDMYFDVGMDAKNEFRFRIGQSKVPFGFENLQSSQNRLPLDRNDALNSAVSNERDLGIFFYWAPKNIRERFSMLVRDGLKGSGDYGVIGFGAYNGQTANKPELNNRPTFIARVSYPLEIGNQIIEPAIQAYTGKYVINKDQLTPGVKSLKDRSYADERIAGSFILYPKPFGIQAEYNFGRGPEFNPRTDSIETQSLQGGYVTLNYRTHYKQHQFYPFIRAQYYDGGKKHERDARSYTVRELEFGVEWQPVKTFELVAMYTLSDRRFEDFSLPDNRQKGSLLRLQAQINF